QGHVQLGGDREAPVLAGPQLHLGVDADVADLELLAAGDRGQGALEAGCVADREELLGVGAAALAAQLGRDADVDLEGPVGAAAVPLGSTSGDVRLSGVEILRHLRSFGRWATTLVAVD